VSEINCPCAIGELRPPSLVDGERHIWCDVEDDYVDGKKCYHPDYFKPKQPKKGV